MTVAWFFVGREWDGGIGAREKLFLMIVLILTITACDFDKASICIRYSMRLKCHRAGRSLPSQHLFSGEGDDEQHAERGQVLWRIVEESPLATSALVEHVILVTNAGQSYGEGKIIA